MSRELPKSPVNRFKRQVQQEQQFLTEEGLASNTETNIPSPTQKAVIEAWKRRHEEQKTEATPAAAAPSQVGLLLQVGVHAPAKQDAPSETQTVSEAETPAP